MVVVTISRVEYEERLRLRAAFMKFYEDERDRPIRELENLVSTWNLSEFFGGGVEAHDLRPLPFSA